MTIYLFKKIFFQDWSVTENENSIISSEESNKIRTHKRYKLNNEDIEIQSNDINFVESLNVTREIVRCNSPHLNSANKNHTVKPCKLLLLVIFI